MIGRKNRRTLFANPDGLYNLPDGLLSNMGKGPAPTGAKSGGEPRRRGLFGRFRDWANRTGEDGISNADRLATIGAMMRDDPAIGQHALQRQNYAAQQYNARRDERVAQEGAANTAAKDRLQRASQADQMGLQGRERFLFLTSPDQWGEMTGDNLYRQVEGGRHDITPDGINFLEDPYQERQEDRADRRTGADIRNINSQIQDRVNDNALARDRFGLDERNISSQIEDRAADNLRADQAGQEPRQFNAQQSASAEFAHRAIQANDIITDISGGGEYDPTARARFRNLPVVGDTLRGDTARQWDQASEQFALSVLRRESGAAISPQERVEIERTYFPQPGDGPETIQQKAIARQTVIEGMQRASQGAYDQFYGGAPQPGQGGLTDEERRELEELRSQFGGR